MPGEKKPANGFRHSAIARAGALRGATVAFKDLLIDTLRTLWAHKLRTFLTMFGIAWGIVSIMLMVAAGQGLEVGQEQDAATFGKNIMIVFAGRTSLQAGGMRAGRPIHFFDNDYLAIHQQTPSCSLVLPELSLSGAKIASAFNNASAEVTGSLPPFADVRSIGVATGRFYGWDDVARASRVAFIGSWVKQQLFSNRSAVGRRIRLNGIPYTVIGVMKYKDQDDSYDGMDVTKVYVPFTAMERDIPLAPPAEPDTISDMIATPRSYADDAACKAELRAALGRLHHFNPRDREAVSIWDTVENAKDFRRMTDGMKYFLGAIGLVSLFLGGIGVMNIMLVAVRERTREIGVRRAVGATSRSILQEFFVETLIVTLLSGATGMGVALGVCGLVDLLPKAPFFAGLIPSWTSGILSFALLGLVAVLSALYPASRAANLDPVEALRFEAGG